ncbi:pseudouridylate synthase [Pseudoalteromonas distincta]|uniref:RluA family pseudouridine synthase n=1 Tax=Pseudoalteromonas distincta TaxID=77608 RepID=A0ABT9GEL3_9GAMM|nr:MULTISPECIES: RluA family pseudouridine synthase [Pseudoalteromonas distincta group]KHM49433.1 pseudouridylate synthase [Pseudoalteromonas elyakovii]KID39662.1 pseudouridylate synthase [Pseudoalteromonas distincta]MDP4484324.1 RluA family pseudouridine synthase [Pseudoalteromonas elyakovii]
MANSILDTPVESQMIVDDFVAPKCDGFIEILYQDDDILLINKPSGLLSLSGKNPLNWDSVHYRLVHGQKGLTAAFAEAKLPHRLDFGTSGIMIVGLNAIASKHLNKQFQARSIQKRYVAMLEGSLAVDEGQITAPIAKDKLLFPRVKICQSTGKTALSEYKVLERLRQPCRTLVQFTPITGRTHQLRIHSQFIGHPILGCDLYKSAQSEHMAGRLQLHASDVSFEHPATGEKIHINCPHSF